MPKNIKAVYAEGARDFAQRLIGRDFTDDELAAAVGALDDATLKVAKKGITSNCVGGTGS